MCEKLKYTVRNKLSIKQITQLKLKKKLQEIERKNNKKFNYEGLEEISFSNSQSLSDTSDSEKYDFGVQIGDDQGFDLKKSEQTANFTLICDKSLNPKDNVNCLFAKSIRDLDEITCEYDKKSIACLVCESKGHVNCVKITKKYLKLLQLGDLIY